MRVSDFTQPTENMAEASYRFLAEKILTEENTDFAIDLLLGIVPARVGIIPIPKFIIRRILDSLIPEQILAIISKLMEKGGWTTERRLDPQNPFVRKG